MTCSVKANADGRLFGSVSPADVLAKLAADAGVDAGEEAAGDVRALQVAGRPRSGAASPSRGARHAEGEGRRRQDGRRRPRKRSRDGRNMAGAGEAGAGVRTPRPGDRIPPHSEDAERALLGCALQDAARILDLCIGAADFGRIVLCPAPPEPLRDDAGAAYRAQTGRFHHGDRAAPRDAACWTAWGAKRNSARLIDGTPTTAHAEYYHPARL